MMDILIGLLFKGIKPPILAWYRDRTGIAQKMHRLEMLVAKVQSVTEVYKKVEIKNDHLNKLQDMFDKAATEGAEVLRKLRDEVDSSSSSSGASNFFERMVSRDKKVEELNRTLEQMEDVSVNVKDFLKTLKLELSNLIEQRKRTQDISDGWWWRYASRGTPARYTSPVEEDTFLPKRKKRLVPTRLQFHSHPRPDIDPLMSVKSPEEMPNNFVADISQADAVNSEEQKSLSPIFLYELQADAVNSKESPEEDYASEFISRPKMPKESQADAVNSKEESLSEDYVHDALHTMPLELLSSSLPKLLTKMPKESQADAVNSKEESLSEDYVHDALHTMPMELLSSSLPKLLTSEQIEQVAAADRLVAELQDAVDKVEQQGEDDSWFSQWIMKLKAAIEEGTCVVSAIKSNNYCVDDQIFDEVGVILTAVCQKLGSMRNELDDFIDLAETEKLAREYTALRDAHSNKNSSLTLSL